jgi:hypothetical protein
MHLGSSAKELAMAKNYGILLHFRIKYRHLSLQLPEPLTGSYFSEKFDDRQQPLSPGDDSLDAYVAM